MAETDKVIKETTYTKEEVREYGKAFDEFIQKHRTDSDWTHTSFGPPNGKFMIDGLDYDKFLNLYKRVVKYKDLHLTERQKAVGPLLLDFDFRIDKDADEKEDRKYRRKYTRENILDIIELFNKAILKYLKIRKIEAFVFEKDKPTYDSNKDNYKDGFHIIYPYPIHVSMRFMIYEEVREYCESKSIFKNIPHINDYKDIFDISVIMRNVWMMYGSRKDKGALYKLTGIYDQKLREVALSKYDHEELVVLLSVRQFDEDDKLELNDDVNNDEMNDRLKNTYDKYMGPKKKPERVKEEKEKRVGSSRRVSASDSQDTNMARKLLGLLSTKRAESYFDWIYVGWALHNVDEGLLDDYIEFSKKAPGKYEEGCCERVWDKARDEGYSISSLYHWAQMDNPNGYYRVMQERVNRLIEEAETGNHDDLAKVIYEMYKHRYKCVSISKNKWYEFQEHRWVAIDSAFSLYKLISDEITKEFAFLVTKHLAGMNATADGSHRDGSARRAHDVINIINNLKKHPFKGSLIGACAIRFYDSKFEEKLDENPDLLGFDNGIYDLKNGCFRPGTPDDYVTMSVGYNYKEYHLDDPELKEIQTYFKQVMQEEDMREYVLSLIASYLDGHCKQQKFIIWTGSGGNGKSITTDLMKLSMGNYYGILATTVLTRRAGSSSNATPELADKRGKRALVMAEPEEDDTIYVGRMKNLTGADTVPARALYGDPFEYKPQFKLILACNNLPHIPANDGGTWRRIRVTPWESEFVDVPDPKNPKQIKKDYDIPEKIKRWKQHFMWYLLKVHYPKYKKEGINEPSKVTKYTDQYKQDSDVYYEFLKENFELSKDKKDVESVTAIFTTFKQWYKEAGYSTTNIPARKNLLNYLINKANLKVVNGRVFGIKWTETDTKKIDDDD